MAGATIGFGLTLVVLGVAAYFAGGRESVTAMIPAFLGVPIAACGFIALRMTRERPALLVAGALGALGVVGALGRIVSTIASGDSVDWNLAALTQVVMAVVCAALVVLVAAGLFRSGQSSDERGSRGG